MNEYASVPDTGDDSLIGSLYHLHGSKFDGNPRSWCLERGSVKEWA
jgi:hypothetical protein